MVRNIFLILVLSLFASVASSQSLSVSGRAEIPTIPERQRPAVNIRAQPGTPLRISSLKTKWATPDEQMLEIYSVVENVSGMEIRAYALCGAESGDLQTAAVCLLHNIQAQGKVLRPGDSDSKSTWIRVPKDSAPTNFDLVLDFVEFVNGTTWGFDACQSAEKLSGLRAGAQQPGTNY